MKVNLQKLLIRCFTILLAIGLGIVGSSCEETETTDSTEFAIYYAGITDIGPSMNFTLDSPTYIGGAPSDFSITHVTLDGEVIDTSCFTIDTNTGAISIASQYGNLAIGLYALSISCCSNGGYYEFKDAVSINVMRAVPEGITVDPNLLTVDYADIITDSNVELPTAQVSTNGEHISITKYLIANVRKDGELVEEQNFFKISSVGEVSIVKGASKIAPGKYVLDLRLTTAAVGEDSEEGIFTDALTIDVTSRPLSLVYTPSTISVEENIANTTAAPTFVGSLEGLAFAIKSVEPQTSAISIDAATGAISMAADNSLPIGTVCNVTVTATNKYGTVDFENALTMKVVAYIAPIEAFSYEDTEEIIQTTAFEHQVAEIVGDEVAYSFVNLPTELADLNIDTNTGTISAKKGNTIPVGEYTVTVLAKNNKNEKETSFKLTVIENPYFFTYVHWGNNIGMSPAKDYATQYRVTSKDELLDLSLPLVESDIPEGIEVEWSIDEANSSVSNAQIDEDGTITFTGGWADGRVNMILIKATTGKGTAGEITVKTPIFVHCSAPVSGVTINYTPFVFQVNPRTGGTSAVPTLEGVEPDKFLADYRRTFSFYNINGPEEHLTGRVDKVNNGFLYIMWKSYFDTKGKSTNTGSKDPVSYYSNVTSLSLPLLYVDATNGCAIKVNPNKWKDDYGYANGVFTGQITFVTDGNSGGINSGKQVFPIAIWFDTKF